jgi:hypothetical protein
MTTPIAESTGETTFKGRARTVFAYTVSFTALCVAAGVVQGIGRYILFGKESAYPSGQLDADSAISVVVTLIISACVYRHLARRHADDFLVLGAAIAALEAMLNLLYSAIVVPAGTQLQGWLIWVTCAFYGIVMLVSGIAFGAIKLRRGHAAKGGGASEALVAPTPRMAQFSAVPFAVFTLGFTYSSFFSLRELAHKVGAQAGLEFLLSLIVHLIVAGMFVYLTWRTYKRPTILLVSAALAYVIIDFVINVFLAGVGGDFIAKYWTQAIAVGFGLVGLRGVVKEKPRELREEQEVE